MTNIIQVHNPNNHVGWECEYCKRRTLYEVKDSDGTVQKYHCIGCGSTSEIRA